MLQMVFKIKQLKNNLKEHFIVWMQIESFQNFRKLWGRIEEDIEPGNYTFLIHNSNIFVFQMLNKKII